MNPPVGEMEWEQVKNIDLVEKNVVQERKKNLNDFHIFATDVQISSTKLLKPNVNVPKDADPMQTKFS